MRFFFTLATSRCLFRCSLKRNINFQTFSICARRRYILLDIFFLQVLFYASRCRYMLKNVNYFKGSSFYRTTLRTSTYRSNIALHDTTMYLNMCFCKRLDGALFSYFSRCTYAYIRCSKTYACLHNSKHPKSEFFPMFGIYERFPRSELLSSLLISHISPRFPVREEIMFWYFFFF